MVAAQLVQEMEDKATTMPLNENDKRRFWDLAQLPDEIVVPFDTRQAVRTEEPTHKRINFTDRLEP
jgi:hypothetical protein